MQFHVRLHVASLLVFSLAAVSPGTTAAEPGWIPLGPEAEQRVLSVEVLPGASGTVFASSLSGLFRTAGGSRWEILNGDGLPLGASGRVHAAPTAGGPLYLATDRLPFFATPATGVFRSDDGGRSWSAVRDHGGRLAVAPGDPSRLYLATLEGVEVSGDGGDTWTTASPLPLPEKVEELPFQLGGVAVAPSDPDTVYVVADIPGDHGVPPELLLFRSTDGGLSWGTIQGPDLGSVGAEDLVLDPHEPSTLYLVLSAGIYRSLDGGATWEPRNEGLPVESTGGGGQAPRISVEALAVDPREPGTLYAALRSDTFQEILGGVFRSTNGGATWEPAAEGLPLPISVQALAVDPADPAALYAGTPKGVFRSPDRGGHWSPIPGLPTPVTAVTPDPSAPATVLVGTDDRRLFLSEDGGQAWRRTGAAEISPPLFDYIGDPVGVVALSPTEPRSLFMDSVFVDGFPRIPRSTDGGATWEILDPVFADVREMLVDPRDPTRILAARRELGGVFASTDRGESWERLFQGRIEALVQAPSEPGVLYAGQGRTVCRSADDGASWECSDAGAPDDRRVLALAVDPRDASVLLAAMMTGGLNREPPATRISESRNGGVTWLTLTPAFPDGVVATDLAFAPKNPKVIWMSTLRGGVLRSIDGGSSWEPLNQGLTHLDVYELSFDPTGRVLLAATGSGLFRFSPTGGPPPPPEIGWVSDPALSGFRVKVRLDQGGGAAVPGTREPACIPETLCLSGALPGRSEVFVRIVGPKPNGHLWPTLVKFTTSRVEVWIQQLSTGELRYYELRGASPGFDELPGLFDRSGFVPG